MAKQLRPNLALPSRITPTLSVEEAIGNRRKVRDAALTALASRFSPLNDGVKSLYAGIVFTRLQQISMGGVRGWVKSSGDLYTILNITKAAPGIIRCVVRKNARA